MKHDLPEFQRGYRSPRAYIAMTRQARRPLLAPTLVTSRLSHLILGMSPGVVRQRCMSEREPELGLGVVASVDPAAKRIAIDFPATRERRLYALGTAVLRRVQFRAGENVTTRDGATFPIESVEDDGGVLTYVGAGRRVREDSLSDVTSVSSPQERLMAGQTDPGEVFDLRF